jgi:CelD/BcsL family acetyltransferase involved in cellulose biosynthesis
MRIEAVHTMPGLIALRQEWERLWQELGQPSPYASYTWVRAWLEAQRLESRLYILLARDDDGSLLGIAPLQRVPLPIPGLGVLTFIGQETSMSPDFLVQAGNEREFCEAILSYISAQRNISGVILKMAEPLLGAKPLLEPYFSTSFGDVRIEQYSERLIVKLPESYEAFLQTLSQKTRQRMRAARKKFSDSKLDFRHNDDIEDFNSRLTDLFALNDQRWGQSGGRRIYEGLYPRLHETGMVKVFSLYIGGRQAAGLAALLSKEGLYAEVAGFDYKMDNHYLGKCLYGLVIEWAILHGYSFLDFGGGSEEYKFRYRPQIFPKYRVTITRSAFGEFLLKMSRRLGRQVRWWREPALL